MLKQIFKKIKKYDFIVIARHIGVDPDAMASQVALRDMIKLTFPEKKVFAVGSGSSRFNFIGRLDKVDEIPKESLLIVLDTPDLRRVDGINIKDYEYSIKIDHHPFIETFCDLELIDDNSSSASELITALAYNTRLMMNKEIATNLYAGIVSDTNRFMFKNSKESTFRITADLIKDFDIDITYVYEKVYMRPLNEIRLQGYISENMVVTENGLGYIKITNDIITKYKADASSAGNLVNNFNFIDEVIVWTTISEDIKNNIIKINIRSRGPEINSLAERYNGGGHKYAAGARVNSMEEVDNLLEELDEIAKKYIENME